MARGETHEITVTITGGVPKVVPSEIRVHEEEKVRWVGSEPFSIEFDDKSPFAEGTRGLSYKEAKQDHEIPKGSAFPVHYHYKVVPEEGKSMDPVIIVGEPTGSHK